MKILFVLLLAIMLTNCAKPKQDGQWTKQTNNTLLRTASCIVVPGMPYCILNK